MYPPHRTVALVSKATTGNTAKSCQTTNSSGHCCRVVCWTPQHYFEECSSPPALCVEVTGNELGPSALDTHVASLHESALSEHLSVWRSWFAFFPLRFPGAHSRRSSVRVVTTLVSAIVTHSCSCSHCVWPWSCLPRFSRGRLPPKLWLCASWSAGTSRRRHALDD